MNSNDNTIDLQRRRMARDMEKELGGLFGIDVRDIESALDRVQLAIERGEFAEFQQASKLPELLERTVNLMEIVYQTCQFIAQDEEQRHLLPQVIELVEHQRGKIVALQIDPQGTH